MGDAVTVTVLLGSYLNGHLSVCWAPSGDGGLGSEVHADDSGCMAGEEPSELICTHVCDRSDSAGVAEAYVPSYAMGGGPVVNSVWASLVLSVSEADWLIRRLVVAPVSSVGHGALVVETECMPN